MKWKDVIQSYGTLNRRGLGLYINEYSLKKISNSFKPLQVIQFQLEFIGVQKLYLGICLTSRMAGLMSPRKEI